MAYSIEWDVRAYKELKSIQNQDAVAILNAISRLSEDPLSNGKPLEGKFKGKHRLRVGSYRVVYWIDEKNKTVFIMAIGHRREIYREN